VQSVGTVHTATIAGTYDMAQRFLRRLGDESDFDDSNGAPNTSGGPLGFAPFGPREDLPPALLAYGAMPTKAPPASLPSPSRYRAWLEGYGIWARTDAQGAIPGNDRRMYGLAGGFSYLVSPNLRLGFGVDQGWQSVDLDAVSESAKIDMTQVGVHAAYRSGGWLANAAGVFGFGSVNANHGNLGLGGVSAASYDVRMWGVLGEVGRRFMFGDVRIVPKVGFDWISVGTDGFTENGGLALTVGSHTAERTRLWGGVEVGRRFASGTSVFDLSAYGRVVGIVSGDQVLLPVAFAAAPGVPLTISGTHENDLGIDTGAKASVAVSRNALVYAAYDGRFRDGFTAHAASGGVKVRW
jgi:outer membrane autotransporter protein